MKRAQHKIPQERCDYPEISRFVVERISQIVQAAIESGSNKIFIHTNLRRGLPLENINKVAGPFVEAWALEQFETIAERQGAAQTSLRTCGFDQDRSKTRIIFSSCYRSSIASMRKKNATVELPKELWRWFHILFTT